MHACRYLSRGLLNEENFPAFESRMRVVGVPSVMLFYSAAIISGAALDYNRSTTPTCPPSRVTYCLRAFVLFYLVQPVVVMAGVFYHVQIDGFRNGVVVAAAGWNRPEPVHGSPILVRTLQP